MPSTSSRPTAPRRISTCARRWRRPGRCCCDSLRGGERPGVAWAPVPLLLPGERSSTEDEPARSLYAALPAFDARPGVWRADLMIGYVWADEPRATAAAVVTGTDRAEALAAAEEIAARVLGGPRRLPLRPGDRPARRDARSPPRPPRPHRSSWRTPATTRPAAGSATAPTCWPRCSPADWQDALIAGITDRPAVEACFAAGEGAESRRSTSARSLDPAGGVGRVPARASSASTIRPRPPSGRRSSRPAAASRSSSPRAAAPTTIWRTSRAWGSIRRRCGSWW